MHAALITGQETVELVEFPDPTGNQVLVEMQAAPINPSDLAILTSAADLENARIFGMNGPEDITAEEDGTRIAVVNEDMYWQEEEKGSILISFNK